MSEVGYQAQSLQSWGAMADEANETNPALRWPRSVWHDANTGAARNFWHSPCASAVPRCARASS